MGVDYTVFVHLLAPDGRLVAQHDGEPWDGEPLPTSSWQPGEQLRDRHVVLLPTDLAPGTYHIQVGVYAWQTGERLPMSVEGTPAGDAVDLGSLIVE